MNIKTAAIKAIECAESGAELARRLSGLKERPGITRKAINKWKTAGVPPARTLDVEKCTGISRHVLRPDIHGEPQPGHKQYLKKIRNEIVLAEIAETGAPRRAVLQRLRPYWED